MRPAAKRQPVVRAARPGAGGVVSRPGLWERLAEAARVTVVSAPAGSGKTVLLRSWIGAAGLAERAAWVPVGRDELDPQRLWLAVLDALRQTTPGAALVRPLTAGSPRAALNRRGDAGVSSVSCASAGECSAGGFYDDAAGIQGFVVNET